MEVTETYLGAPVTDRFALTESELAQRENLDDLLKLARDEVAEQKRKDQTPLAALLGHYEPIEGHPGFFARAPKLRQQIEIAKLSEAATQATTMSANLYETAKMACLAIFRCEDEQMVTVGVEDFLDEFDGTETVGFLTKYLGLETQKDEKDPNAPA